MTEKRLLQINTIPFIQSGFMSTLMTHLQIIMIKIRKIKNQHGAVLIIEGQHQFGSELILRWGRSALWQFVVVFDYVQMRFLSHLLVT